MIDPQRHVQSRLTRFPGFASLTRRLESAAALENS